MNIRWQTLVGLAVLLLAAGGCAGRAAGPDGDGLRDSLFVAVRAGDAARVAEILQGNPGLARAVDEWRQTPLHRAATAGSVEICRMLLKCGADCEAKEGKRFTPLHLAAREGKLAVVDLLLASGADIEARTKDRLTPLLLAAAGGQTDTVRLLLDKGAYVNARGTRQMTIATLAWFQPNGDEIVNLAIERGYVGLEWLDGCPLTDEDLQAAGKPIQAVCRKAGSASNGLNLIDEEVQRRLDVKALRAIIWAARLPYRSGQGVYIGLDLPGCPNEAFLGTAAVQNACFTLAKRRDAASYPRILYLIRHETAPWTMLGYALALEEIDDPAALPVLWELAGAGIADPIRAQIGVGLLVRRGHPEAVGKLVEIFRHIKWEEGGWFNFLHEALCHLTGTADDLAQDASLEQKKRRAERWLNWWKENEAALRGGTLKLPVVQPDPDGAGSKAP